MLYYAGIGSRQTPTDVLEQMQGRNLISVVKELLG